MREIAAIGADFRQLSSFTDDVGGESVRPSSGDGVGGLQSNGGGNTSHEQILIGQ